MIRALARRLLGEGADPTPPHALSKVLGPDGCPILAPEQAAQALLDHLGAPAAALTGEETAALVGASHALTQIAGELGWLPGTIDPSQKAADRPLHRLQLLLESMQLPIPAPPGVGVDWTAWAWRQTGSAVAHARFKSAPSRVWISPHGMQWDWRDETLLSTEASDPLTLEIARVDAPRFCSVQTRDGFSRRLEARKMRLIFQEQSDAARTARWRLGAHWQPARTEQGALGTCGDHQLVIKLDPSWQWSVSGGEISGEGAGALHCSFELR